MFKISDYITSSIQEMKKVTWPTRKETREYTLLVIGVSLSVAAFLGALDFLFSKGFEFLLK